jgi:phosphoglycerol transferase
MWCQDEFLPELDGIGDVLEEHGYQNTLLIGSHAMFGGRNLFYRDHGNYEIYDYYDALYDHRLPTDDYKVFWGYEDDKLFEFAKEFILEDAASGQPFNMTLLTVDTHYEDGYFCQDCVSRHPDNPYEDVYNCSDQKIAEFISWVQQQDFYENTTIVLAGDHLTMDSDFCKNLDPADKANRRVYTAVINGAATPENDVMREFSTLDLFPTTLAAMGVEIEGDRLGLGTNLYSSQPTLLELYGKDEMNTAFNQKSVMMEHLGATIDLTKEELKMYE